MRLPKSEPRARSACAAPPRSRRRTPARCHPRWPVARILAPPRPTPGSRSNLDAGWGMRRLAPVGRLPEVNDWRLLVLSMPLSPATRPSPQATAVEIGRVRLAAGECGPRVRPPQPQRAIVAGGGPGFGGGAHAARRPGHAAGHSRGGPVSAAPRSSGRSARASGHGPAAQHEVRPRRQQHAAGGVKGQGCFTAALMRRGPSQGAAVVRFLRCPPPPPDQKTVGSPSLKPAARSASSPGCHARLVIAVAARQVWRALARYPSRRPRCAHSRSVLSS